MHQKCVRDAFEKLGMTHTICDRQLRGRYEAGGKAWG